MKKIFKTLKNLLDINNSEEKEIKQTSQNIPILKGEIFEIRMPKFHNENFKGKVVEHFFNIGEIIQTGDLIAEIETEKATLEFEAAYGGKIIWICELDKELNINDTIIKIHGI
ncbi:biotin/lipoyl-containing protein [Aureivirga marina]|uniref:biotin/lipoyl-containing protein n=1 Tax=Aureivirga marina TaxID=1182451 RepID=UPI0018CA65D6|nr:biotin/lipoyl-containing protein [Aureivirga marina]